MNPIHDAMRQDYSDSLSDAKRERDRLVDASRALLADLTKFLDRESPSLRLMTDESKDPSPARLSRLSEVLGWLDHAQHAAKRKL